MKNNLLMLTGNVKKIVRSVLWGTKRNSQNKLGRFEDNLYWRDLNVGYITVPKTGNTSLKLALASNLDWLDEVERGEIEEDYQAIHRILRQKPCRVNKETLLQNRSCAFLFSFVRNPWARLASFHRDKILGDGWSPEMQHRFAKAYGIPHGSSFNRTLKVLRHAPDSKSELHFRSQWSILQFNGQLVPHAVFRFENLNVGWDVVRARIRERTGKDIGEPPHMNKTTDDDYRTFYGARERDWVYKRFKTDIELFGYEF